MEREITKFSLDACAQFFFNIHKKCIKVDYKFDLKPHKRSETYINKIGFFHFLQYKSINLKNNSLTDLPESSSQNYKPAQSSKSQRSSNHPTSSPPKSQKQPQASRIIEPLPGPNTIDWKKQDSEQRTKSETQKASKIAQTNKPFLAGSSSSKLDSARSEVHRYEQPQQHRKSSLNKREHPQQSPEHVVLDRFGRPMTVRGETMKVLKQLPDISFLSARTLLYNPEQKQIVQDLGAMINRKMPG